MTSANDEFQRGLALHQQGRLDEAEKRYRRILRTAPTHFDALHLLGVIAGQTNRFDEAHQLLTRALAQRPDSAPALTNMGNVLGNLGRHLEAIQTFERALALRPDDAKALRNRGTSLRALERPEEALASFDAALALKPDYPEALIGRAEALLTLHRRGDAIQAFRQALPLGMDVEQIRYALAALGDEPAPPTAPPRYVEELFDSYSQNFDQHLVGKLAYRTPELLLAELQRAQPQAGSDIIDLGCGTGLCGPLLRPLARRLIGVDLSSQMLARAQALGLYDELLHADLTAALAGPPARFDIAVAADVFVYIGDLDAVFAATAAALRPGGLFAFSVEAADGVDFELNSRRRYAHSLAYLQRLAAAHGFSVESATQSVIRKEGDEPVNGLLIVMRLA
ncbi:tetratricopeptide repeat protein [Roseateles asaccharophilus]|uniref:TPR repeat methyltransferase n=1 Tax=Roseateles asaccharophilus TaxID=582607 RepID=A0ABU2ADU4_9BURK|nr:tetratricopeptide repeat protein [Roseateles asaccharophilus]MDR7335372.1 putative TPR repeat methyltransferase [Roseateles asaccharophilus]